MKDLKEIRQDINEIDEEIRKLFVRRMDASRQVAEYKTAHGLPIYDKEREAQVIEINAAKLADDELRPYYINFMQDTMAVSRSYQDMLMNGMSPMCPTIPS